MTWLNLSTLPKGTVGAGSSCFVAAVPEEWIDNMPDLDPTTQTITATITLKPGRDWFKLLLVSRIRVYKEESQRGDAGISYTQSVSGKSQGQSEAIHIQMENYMHHRWVLLAKEVGTGLCYLIGKPESGALLNIQYANDKATQTSISFSRNAVGRGILYAGTLP